MRTMIGVIWLTAILGGWTPAYAHGGERVFAGEEGPYAIESYVLRDDDSLDYTMTLREVETNRPVDGATVRVAARSSSGSFGPEEAEEFGGAYTVYMPAGGGDYRVEVDIEGPSGAATIEHDFTLETSGSGWARWAVLVGVVSAGVSFGVWRRYGSSGRPRRRRSLRRRRRGRKTRQQRRAVERRRAKR